MSLRHHRVPFPCVVYVRRGSEYRFSHFCVPQTGPVKPLPASLRVRDLQEHARQPPLLGALRRACFLVLVAGDTAQCVSVGCARGGMRFLYRGSEYARPVREGQRCAEFHEDYVPLRFYSTLALYGRARGLASVKDIECGVALFPRRLGERVLATVARWADHCVKKSVHGSVWLCTDAGESFNEHTRRRRRAARGWARTPG
jgi:hypothetical protein